MFKAHKSTADQASGVFQTEVWATGSRRSPGVSLRRLALLGTALAGVSALPAHAQAPAGGQPQMLEEVLVTAERRVDNLQKTAASVSVRQGGELQAQGKFTLSQILEDVPGVQGGAASGAAGAGTDAPGTGVAIRGISSNAPLGGSISSTVPATAIYVDDIVGGIGGDFDIGRVEVLRGPQGTLYGRSATAGVVAIHTKDPEFGGFSGDVALEAGNHDLRHYTGAVNIPVNDVLALRISGNHYGRDGYYAKQGDTHSSDAGRIKALFKPNDEVSLLLGFALQNNDDNNGELNGQVVSPGKLAYTAVPVGSATNETRLYWAHLDWDLGPVVMTYIPAYRTWEQKGVAYTQGGLLLRQTMSTPRDHFLTQELRFASDSESALRWQAGGFYYKNSLSNHNLVENQSPVVPGLWSLSYRTDLREKETVDYGVFGEATYAFTDTTRLTAGLRYDRTTIDTDQDYTSSVVDSSTSPPSSTLVSLHVTPATSGREFTNTTFKVRLEHDLTPQNLVYGSVSTGFLPGDINVTSGSGGPYVSDFDTETLTSYEVGSKNRFFGNTLQVNGSLYYYQYGGYQVGGVNVAPPGATALELVTLTSKAEVKGGELELAFQPTRTDRFGLNLNVSEARYIDRTATFAANVAKTDISGVSPVTANLSYIRTVDLPSGQTLEAGLDVRYRAGYDFAALSQLDLLNGLAPLVKVDDQITANAHVSWIADRFSLTGYVRNLSDERYIESGSVVPGAGVPGGPAPANIVVARYAEPRTFGVILAAKF